jgi:hypothetical protein
VKSRVGLWTLALLLSAGPLAADPAFLARATDLLAQGKLDDAASLAQGVLATTPGDPDALVITGTVVLYRNLSPRRLDSIYRTDADPAADPEPALSPPGVAAVAQWWKRVPALDPARAYLWGDLAQLTFRAGDSAGALEYAAQVLALAQPDPGSLKAAASVFLLNLDTARAAQALAKIPGNRSNLLYRGLDAWRTGNGDWRTPLKTFVDNPGDELAGRKLAAYLIGPAMRDGEAGFLAALQVEPGVAALTVRQKYAQRYPNKFMARIDLARSLSQFGSFARALVEYAEIDRLGLAGNDDERLAVVFQEAWAQQGSGHLDEANRLWTMLTDARDFYLRSAAAWFLGANAQAAGKLDEAKSWWTAVADEPARSKYAYWADQELKKLRRTAL